MISFCWCPFTRAERVFWMLEEVGVEYEPVLVDIRKDPRSDPAGFTAASPLGKVPAITDPGSGSGAGGEAKIADSAAIAMYLGDRYAAGRLAPALDDPLRGEYLTWTLFTPSVIEPAMSELVSGAEAQPTRNAWGSWETMLAALETRLTGREWIVGDDFTMADLMVAGSIDFMAQFGMLEPSPVLQRYRERARSRPAAVRAGEEQAKLIEGADFTAP
ncbi:MAG: glutathione S-transferase family protein [Pacificimonas sp.]|jgi:glutathione S-transferase|nr:glutathione S-transferase family protein [Pacificimonas sp.]